MERNHKSLCRLPIRINDVVFKYLMEDNKIAKLFISSIIGEEIDSLEFRPQESILEVERRSYSQITKGDIRTTNAKNNGYGRGDIRGIGK